MEPEFEALLKRQVQGAGNGAACHQFNPDMASAYLEQALTRRALTTYEEHLASCASCRRDLIELSRLLPPIAVETVIIRQSLPERLSEWFSGWRLGAVAGFGAVAATVLLVAVMVNRSSQESASPMVAGKQNEAQATPEPFSATVATEEAKRQSTPTPSASIAANGRLTDQSIAKATPPATVQSAGEASGVVAPPPPPPASLPAPSKAEIERKEITADQIAVARQNQIQNLRSQTPSGPEVNQSQVDRAMERAKKDNEKDSEPAPPSAGAMAAPKPALKSAEKPSERVVERQRALSVEAADQKKSKQPEMRAVSAAKSSAPRSKVVSGKTFRQENGLWIDEAYEPGKGLSIIRLTPDSESYKQTLKETPALKPYFDLKPVIVVWQGKVYRVEK